MSEKWKKILYWVVIIFAALGIVSLILADNILGWVRGFVIAFLVFLVVFMIIDKKKKSGK